MSILWSRLFHLFQDFLYRIFMDHEIHHFQFHIILTEKFPRKRPFSSGTPSETASSGRVKMFRFKFMENSSIFDEEMESASDFILESAIQIKNKHISPLNKIII